MKDTTLYTVIFVLLMCSVCSALLTFANTQWEGLIQANKNFARVFAITDALGLVSEETERKEVTRAFNEYVRKDERGEMILFEGRKDNQLLGYALPFTGHGKYDVIRGILAIGPTSQRIKALRIYEQNETPGLGGRISEAAWLEQFEGLPLTTEKETGIIISSTVEGPNVVDGISGASGTTFSLGNTLNGKIAQFLAGGMVLEALDLKLGEDDVTRATPGYPKHIVEPPNLRQNIERRPAFMAPPGIKNLAMNKPVTSSLEEIPIMGELEQINDGIKKSGEFDFVELDPGPQWVQIDLGVVETVYAIVIWHYYKNAILYNDVIVQIADDAEFTQNVRTLFNNDHDNSSGLGAGEDTAFYGRWWGELVDTRGADKRGTPLRYVRVWTNGGAAGELSRFVEIAAYGDAK